MKCELVKSGSLSLTVAKLGLELYSFCIRIEDNTPKDYTAFWDVHELGNIDRDVKTLRLVTTCRILRLLRISGDRKSIDRRVS